MGINEMKHNGHVISNEINHLASTHIPRQLIAILIMHKHIFETY